MPELELRVTRYDHPDAVALVDAVQREYVRRYGGPDESVLTVEEFSPPRGVFLVGYEADEPVAMGGFRMLAERPELAFAHPAAELKRLYVVDGARGRAYARRMLAEVEARAAAAGAAWLVLETGLRQPEALALYASSGYEAVTPFGHYADSETSRYLGRPLV